MALHACPNRSGTTQSPGQPREITAPNAFVTLTGGGSGRYMIGSIRAANVIQQCLPFPETSQAFRRGV